MLLVGFRKNIIKIKAISNKKKFIEGVLRVVLCMAAAIAIHYVPDKVSGK
jgi:hypothetical protein